MLEKIKENLGITGTFQDNTIQDYIDEVKQFLLDGGVAKSIVEADSSIGIITRGVADLWNYGSGGTSLSPYFIQRAIQLSYKNQIEPDDPDLFYTKEEIDKRLSPLTKMVNNMFIETNSFEFVSTENQNTFAFSGEYDVIDVIVNGLTALRNMYEIQGNSVVLNNPLTANQKVEIILYKLNKEGA